MIKALVFDFDGLIIDTEGPIFHSWRELFEQHQCNLTHDTWSTIVGLVKDIFDPFDLLEEQYGKPVDRVALRPLRARRELQIIHAQPVLPGVLETLRHGRELGLRIGLASSSPREWVHGHLERLGMKHLFECIRTADQVANPKPEPDLYLSVLEYFGLQGPEAVAFEDSPPGVVAAKRAGLYCVAVPNDLTRGFPLAEADLRVNSLAELTLPNILKSLNGHVREAVAGD